MNPNMFEAVPPSDGAGQDLPHLSGPAAAIRQVLAAHFVRGCAHALEIGGYRRPLTGYLTHAPLSVTSIDPKTAEYEAEELDDAKIAGSPFANRRFHVLHPSGSAA